MNKLYLLSKSVHRYLVLIISVWTLVMAGTGTIMKYESIGESMNIDAGLVRYLHDNVSIFFTATLVLMMTSGIIMYFVPVILRSRANQTSSR